MSNMVINVIHKPISLASESAHLRSEWQRRKWAGNRPIPCGVGSSSSIMESERAWALEGLFQLEKGKKTWGHAELLAESEGEHSLCWNPTLECSCALLAPLTCWQGSGAHFSLPTRLAAQLSHASLSGAVRGCHGMTEFSGHFSPSWARSPQGQPLQWLTRTAPCSWRAGLGLCK